MRRAAALAALAGLLVATILLAHAGVGAVTASFATAGLGVVGATLFHLVPMALNGQAWRILVGRGRGRSLPFFVGLVWVREAVNGLLPVARVGGEVATARLLLRRGIRAPAAVASLVVDMTVALGTQAAFTVVGLTLLAARHPGSALARPAWLAVALALPLVALLVLVQRGGVISGLGRAARRLLGERLAALQLPRATGRLDRALQAVWASRWRTLRCAGWQLLGWAAAAGELWIFLRAAGAEVSAADALLVEALVQAVASAAFVVPAALGVQEGAFLALGTAIGLTPALSLALALSRRARDVLLFVPALLWWQAGEGRATLQLRNVR